ncbi:MAG: hypothetical protein JO041_09010, partial [Acidobacteria bacterium]|nr:hypothetical protein [Acidobacteriota bacterium]
TRRHSRRSLRAPVIVRDSTSGLEMCGDINEIGAGGCYFETWTPLPSGTEIEVRCEQPRLTFRAAGRVVYSDPLVGMGIAFAAPLIPPARPPKPAAPGSAPPENGRKLALPHSGAEANTRIVAALKLWFSDHLFLERADFRKLLEEVNESTESKPAVARNQE